VTAVERRVCCGCMNEACRDHSFAVNSGLKNRGITFSVCATNVSCTSVVLMRLVNIGILDALGCIARRGGG
jgi:hypothetical protein